MNDRQQRRTTRGAPLAKAAVLGVAILGLTACEGLLDVEVPGDLTEDELFQPSSAELMVNSAIADWECSYSMMTAIMSGGEDATWKTSGYFTTTAEHQTTRPGGGGCTENNAEGTSWFTGFQKSNYLAEEAYTRLSEWSDEEVDERQRLLATAATYAGLYYTYFGEVYCEFAPEEEGPLLTPTQMLEEAESWYTTALDHMDQGEGDYEIVSTQSLRQLALLGRARTRLAMGDHGGAQADASQIDEDFVAWITRDSSVRPRWNTPYQAFNNNSLRSFAGPVWWYGHEPDELVSAGYLDLTLSPDDGTHTVDEGVADPRVPVDYIGQFATDGVTPQFNQQKYTSQGDNQAMAKWAEAQLILAEVEFETDPSLAVDRINELRATYEEDLPDLELTDPDAIFSAIVEERRREFFLEGRHYADKLRYGLWFPRGRGFNHKEVRYGLGYCMLMPEDAYELNPEIPEDYNGPDLSDLSYTFELEIDRDVQWPVPSETDYEIVEPGD